MEFSHDRPRDEQRMTKRTAGFLAVGVMLCGAVGLWATFSSLSNVGKDRVVGTAALVALALAVIALRRRSWTRLPLLAVCAFAGVLVYSAFLEPYDPMAIAGPAYLFYNALLVMTGAVTLVGSRLTSLPKSTSSDQAWSDNRD